MDRSWYHRPKWHREAGPAISGGANKVAMGEGGTSVRTVLLIVALCAAGLAAVHSATALWLELSRGAAWVALAIALAGAFFARGRRRAFWAGFAIFGWQFFAVPAGVLPGDRLAGDLGYTLAKSVHPLVQTRTPALQDGPPIAIDIETGMPTFDPGRKAERAGEIIRIGLGLLYAGLGGLVAMRFARRRRDDADEGPPRPVMPRPVFEDADTAGPRR